MVFKNNRVLAALMGVCCIGVLILVAIGAFLPDSTDTNLSNNENSTEKTSPENTTTENSEELITGETSYSEDPCPECNQSGIMKTTLRNKYGMDVGYDWKCVHCGASGRRLWG